MQGSTKWLQPSTPKGFPPAIPQGLKTGAEPWAEFNLNSNNNKIESTSILKLTMVKRLLVKKIVKKNVKKIVKNLSKHSS